MDTGLRRKKKELRKETGRKLSALAPEEMSRESRAVSELLMELPEWKEAERLYLFLSMEKEIDTSLLLETAFREGKKVAVPRMYGKEIRFHRIPGLDAGLFSRHPYGILEPLSDLPLQSPLSRGTDLVVTPGMAFDRQGKRLGYGMGFYDRFFTSSIEKYTAIGICFSVQLVESIPAGEYDIPVHGLIAGGTLIKIPWREEAATEGSDAT